MAATRASATPSVVNPYAHHTRDQGQVFGFRQSRANESLNRRRKSSMIGAGSARLHSDHIIHTAIASMMKPENAENATFNRPR